MKEVFDYINSNSFLTTIIGVIIGGLITSLTTIYVSSRERKEQKREKLEREHLEQIKNKAELFIEKNDVKIDEPDIEVFLGTFNVKYSDKNYEIVYSKDITKKDKHDYKDFVIKNIGKSDITQLDIVATFKNHNILVDYELLDNTVENSYVNYSYCYDKKVRVNDNVKIRIYFQKDYQVCHPFSCTLALLFKDSNNRYWEQPFWYERDNLYEPHQLDYKEYKSYVTTDDAYECFEKPYLW